MGVSMNASPTGIVVLCIVAVLCMAFYLTAVLLAARQPGSGNARPENMATGVHGGRHLAVGGRSVAPNRDTLAIPTAETAESAESGESAESAESAESGETAEVPQPRAAGQPATVPATPQPEAAVPAQPPAAPFQAPAAPAQRPAEQPPADARPA
jgi:hypothetical protein